ncbi:hypothetical protein L6472_07205 [Prevotella sp. E13-17]|uniref:hypothetical protein n=1 Tax=Prevotella sp. E13-17 TaxID=2913616 RepID=UPI001EDB530F|nr:hypothetical protein [Prevotella sp. E13-17]UKK49846.1 hypothetical protein L6472_07205 [Prevotella sp. E13-17]
MRKIILISSLFFTINISMSAQAVYTEIRKIAQKHIEDTNSQQIIKDINRFELDALNYMGMKMKEVMPDAPASVLDDQAYALYQFINLYCRTLIDIKKQSKAQQIKIINLFMDISYSNPFFKDPEKNIVLYYFSNEESLTRFSLDTDWQRAYVAASTELKKLSK